MITSGDTENAFDKIQHLFIIKTLIEVGMDGMYLHMYQHKKCINIKNAIYENSTANIIVNSENLKVFSLNSGMRQGCPFYLTLH